MKNVIYTQQLKDQLAMIVQASTLLAEVVPDKCEEQLLAEIDFIKDRLDETKPLIGAAPTAEQEDIKVRPRVPGKVLQEAFILFLQHNPAKQFGRNLRRILLEHLMYQGATESVYLFETVKGLDALFALLEVAEDEWPPRVLN